MISRTHIDRQGGGKPATINPLLFGPGYGLAMSGVYFYFHHLDAAFSLTHLFLRAVVLTAMGTAISHIFPLFIQIGHRPDKPPIYRKHW